MGPQHSRINLSRLSNQLGTWNLRLFAPSLLLLLAACFFFLALPLLITLALPALLPNSTGSLRLQSSPDQPPSQTHVPSKHTPYFSQRVLIFVHSPCPLQVPNAVDGQGDSELLSEQSSPVYPRAHLQMPSTHTPWPLQLL